MFSYGTYKVLHYFGIMLLFVAFGARISHALAGGEKGAHPTHRLVAISHGVALTIIFVAGFGMHAKLGVDGFPGWFLAKVALWLVIGGLFVLPYRSEASGKPLWFALPILGALAGWLALTKPF